MKISKKSQQIARQIFLATNKDGKTSETELSKFVRLLAREKSSKSGEILSVLKNLLEQQEKSDELLVESAFPISPSQREAIRTHFEKALNRKLRVKEIENKEFISGIKITLADNIWENTVLSNLSKLEGASYL